MGTITPILDTLLHQQLGRRADMERFTATQPKAPLSAITRIAAPRDATSNPALSAQRAASPLATDTGPGRTADSGGADKAAASPRSTAGSVASSGRGNTAQSTLGGPIPADSTALHFSREARTIASLLARFTDASAPSTQASAPLFNGQRAPLVSVLASLLGQQLSDSGVFYESHLQQWLKGKRSLAQLSQEPQARLTRTSANAAQSGAGQAASPGRPSAAGDAAANPASAPGTNPANGGPAAPNAQSGPRLPLAAGPAGVETAAADDSLVPEKLVPVVRQQLDVLSSAIFRWQGQAWPGVPMQWEVHEHDDLPAQANHEPDASDTPYSTRLNIELPALGALQVRLTLSANALQLYAWAESETGVNAIEPRTRALEERLRNAGFETVSVRLLTGVPA